MTTARADHSPASILYDDIGLVFFVRSSREAGQWAARTCSAFVQRKAYGNTNLGTEPWDNPRERTTRNDKASR